MLQAATSIGSAGIGRDGFAAPVRLTPPQATIQSRLILSDVSFRSNGLMRTLNLSRTVSVVSKLIEDRIQLGQIGCKRNVSLQYVEQLNELAVLFIDLGQSRIEVVVPGKDVD